MRMFTNALLANNFSHFSEVAQCISYRLCEAFCSVSQEYEIWRERLRGERWKGGGDLTLQGSRD